jgi:hypothetical protein
MAKHDGSRRDETRRDETRKVECGREEISFPTDGILDRFGIEFNYDAIEMKWISSNSESLDPTLLSLVASPNIAARAFVFTSCPSFDINRKCLVGSCVGSTETETETKAKR